MRLPARVIAPARLKGLLISAPKDVHASLKAGKGSQLLTLEAPIPEVD
jgi:hypothetical protein